MAFRYDDRFSAQAENEELKAAVGFEAVDAGWKRAQVVSNAISAMDFEKLEKYAELWPELVRAYVQSPALLGISCVKAHFSGHCGSVEEGRQRVLAWHAKIPAWKHTKKAI